MSGAPPAARRYASIVGMCGLLLVIGLGGAASPALAVSLKWLPGHSTFRPLLADPREAQYLVRYLASSDRARGEVAFGETFGLVRIGGATSLQWSLQASVYTRFNRDQDSVGFLDLNSADYAVFAPFDVHHRDLDIRIGFGHLSSHLGESEVQRRIFLGAPLFDRRLLYRRDFLEGVVSYDVGSASRIYAGGSYALHLTPNLPRGTAQLGGEWFTARRRLGSLHRQWYLAADFQAWAEADWSVNSNVQAGLRLSDGSAPKRLRVALELYNGHVLQRILADQRERYLSVGLYFEM